MRIFEEFEQNKISLFILLVIIFLGIFIRLNDFSKIGYWNDDVSTIPTGLLPFYSYPVFPGLSGQGEPILGNLIVGLGCKISGEDFSRVSEVKPMFYPGREELIGKQLVNAFPYCHLPMYFFGILFFLVISLLAVTLLDKFAALYAISFYAFYPSLLQLSRWIHVDIFGYFFVALGILFLWHAYSSEKNKREIVFFILSFTSLGLAFATKLPNGIFLIFATLILMLKYKDESMQMLGKIGVKLNLNIAGKIPHNETINYKRGLKIVALSIVAYLIAFLAPFNFRINNFISVLRRYQSVNPTYSGLGFNTNLFKDVFNFILTINPIDTVVFFLSMLLVIKFMKSKKDKKEKFVFYLFMFLLFTLIITRALTYVRVFITFSIGLIFIIALSFSNKENFIFKSSSIKKRSLILTMFIIAYVTFSFINAFLISPHFAYNNQILCKFSAAGCETELIGFVQKDIANYLKMVLKDEETFYWGKSDVLYYYIRQEESYQKFLFDEAVFRNFNRYPTAEEQIQYFMPFGRKTRYAIVNPYTEVTEDKYLSKLKKEYRPNHIIYMKEKEAALIYDLKNLDKLA
ncbi:phospholipid carrier-dependent glycosyltransferase [Candidatus Woesearchaeota archaeon]|nr:phospholipid carrier-dependent glycosyltransferase [Candidatus Woesearchaeota archaeon]